MRAKVKNVGKVDFGFVYDGEAYDLPAGGELEVAEESIGHWIIKKLQDEGKPVILGKSCVIKVEPIPDKPPKEATTAIKIVEAPKPKKNKE